MTALAGQIAVVTGASSGIGAAITLTLAAAGATVCLVGRNRAALDGVAARADVAARAYAADLAHDDDLRRLAAQLLREHPAIDVLVHSAGTFASAPFEAAPLDEFDRLYRVNLRAPFALTQALLPSLRQRRGQIVFINSSAGLAAKGGMSQYAATKHALKALADSLREEANPDGVRVLSVYPGRTASPMQAAIHAQERREYRPERLLQPEDVASVVLNALSLPRSAEITDVQVRPLVKT